MSKTEVTSKDSTKWITSEKPTSSELRRALLSFEEMSQQGEDRLDALMEAVREEEREACAQVVENVSWSNSQVTQPDVAFQDGYNYATNCMGTFIRNRCKTAEMFEAKKNPTPKPGPDEDDIHAECLKLSEFLRSKNRHYGGSALNPRQIFAKGVDPLTLLHIRMDDKLTRLINIAERGETDVEDAALDFVGYWILERIKRRRESNAKETGDTQTK